MATPPVSDEELERTLEAYHRHSGNQTKIADEIGKSRGAVQDRIRTLSRRGLLGTKPVLPGFEITKTTAVTDQAGNVVREFIQQKPEQDRGPFNLPDGHTVKGVSALLDANGRVIQQWMKTREGEHDPARVAEIIREALSDQAGTWQPVDGPKATEDDLLTVYPLVDWHIGLLAWAEECGENYDLSIAQDVILSSMARLINATPPSGTAIILGLGDLLHFDGMEPKTSRSGHVLDTDSRYPKILKTATRMVIDTIDMALARHQNVNVRILQGNHDDVSAVAVALGLSLKYEGHPRVAVDDSASRWWWHRFDKVFLGGNHSERVKMRDMPLVMAHDRPEDWAASTYRRIYTAHRHHENTIEEGGVIVTCMRSPVAKDAYHSFGRWRSGRSVYSETFSRDGREAATQKFNI